MIPAVSRAESYRRLVFLVGLGLMLVLACRAQSGGDQLNLLSRGWLWAERGVFLPYGNPLSNGGVGPGSLTTLLVGAPLFLWRHHRSPVVLVVVFHVLAYLLLDHTLRKILAPRERLLFALVYWLNPWRLYFSGFLWNPNFLFLPAAVHLWTAWRSRQVPGFLPSLLHVVALGAAFQLHPSFVILALASALLWWRRAVRVDWLGVALGALLVLLSLVPWLLAVVAAPDELLPGSEGFPLRGLIYVFPLVRGLLYWLRYASLYLPSATLKLDFTDLLGAAASAAVSKPVAALVAALTPLTVALPVWANARFLRHWRARLRRPERPKAPRGWLREYTLCALLGAALSFALSPTTVMPWQALIVLHAAVLPLVLLGGALVRRRRFAVRVRRFAAGWGVASVALALVLAGGSRYYNCTGPHVMGIGVVLRHDHPMFHDLGWSAECPPHFDAETGWWPDVLPEK